MFKLLTTILLFLSFATFPAQAISTYQPYYIGDGSQYWGSYRRIAYNGNIDWYFSNLALLNGQFSNADLLTYLNLYLARINRRSFTIQNVASNLVTPENPDSNDSYASTFLSLAKKYYDQSHDLNWVIRNEAVLRAIADANLVYQIKPNNLIRAFQAPHPNGIGYLMDNVENYKGLKDFDSLLRVLYTNPNPIYSNTANRVLTGIQSLSDPATGAYKWCDVCVVGNSFYPDITANMFLQVYNVPNINYNEVNDWIEATKPNLSTTKNDSFPWLFLAKYYNVRGDTTRLNEYLAVVDSNFTLYSSTYPIHDWALRNTF